MARQGKLDAALPALVDRLADTGNLASSLQAANVLDRLGEDARLALPAMKERLAGLKTGVEGNRYDGYLVRILTDSITALETSN